MKHLNLRSAICLPALLVLVCFASFLFVPHPAIAKADYTNGSGMAEGDPGDGLGFASGGGGLLSDGGSSSLTINVLTRGIAVGLYVPGYLVQDYFEANRIELDTKKTILKPRRVFGEVHK